jgi:hypothetical protein
MVWLNMYSKSNVISIYDTKTSSVLTYSPNISASFGPGISYKWASLDLSFISLGTFDNSVYGKTNKLDIQGHFHMKKYLVDIWGQFYDGFYLSKYPKSAGYLFPENAPYVRSDISQIGFGGAFLYAFKWDKYSLKASFSQIERQKKSKGTWVLGFYMSIFGTAGDSNLVPTVIRPQIDSTAWFSGAGAYSAGVLGGYMHTFVKDNWYFTLSLLPGFGAQKYVYALIGDTAVQSDNSKNMAKFQARFALGYNSPKTYFGISGISETTDLKNSSSSYMKHSFGVLRLFFGYRFFFEKNKNNSI